MTRLRGDGLGQPVSGPGVAQPWNMPWGVVGRATSTSVQAGITATTDVTSLTTTFNGVVGRLYKIEYICAFGAGGVTTATFGLLVDGTQIAVAGADAAASSVARGSTGVAYTTLTAASHTVKVNATGSAGGVNMLGAATTPHYLIVTDVGPS